MKQRLKNPGCRPNAKSGNPPMKGQVAANPERLPLKTEKIFSVLKVPIQMLYIIRLLLE